jgi:hypothetical protein
VRGGRLADKRRCGWMDVAGWMWLDNRVSEHGRHAPDEVNHRVLESTTRTSRYSNINAI